MLYILSYGYILYISYMFVCNTEVCIFTFEVH